VLLPFAKEPIPDPDFPNNTNQPFYKQGARGFVGLAGESRLVDGNTPMFHAQINAGTNTIANVGDRGEGIFAQTATVPEGVRPIRPNNRPVFRPNVPCETQDPPNLNAPGGPADRSLTQPAGGIGGLLPPLPGVPFNQKIAAQGKAQMNEIVYYLKAKAAGKPAIDPMSTTHANYVLQMKKLGLGVDKLGKVSALPSKAGSK
jgi:hypothetical protein